MSGKRRARRAGSRNGVRDGKNVWTFKALNDDMVVQLIIFVGPNYECTLCIKIVERWLDASAASGRRRADIDIDSRIGRTEDVNEPAVHETRCVGEIVVGRRDANCSRARNCQEREERRRLQWRTHARRRPVEQGNADEKGAEGKIEDSHRLV